MFYGSEQPACIRAQLKSNPSGDVVASKKSTSEARMICRQIKKLIPPDQDGKRRVTGTPSLLLKRLRLRDMRASTFEAAIGSVENHGGSLKKSIRGVYEIAV